MGRVIELVYVRFPMGYSISKVSIKVLRSSFLAMEVPRISIFLPIQG